MKCRHLIYNAMFRTEFFVWESIYEWDELLANLPYVNYTEYLCDFENE